MSNLEPDLFTRADASGLETLVILKRLSVAREEERSTQILKRFVEDLLVGAPCLQQNLALELRYLSFERQCEGNFPAVRVECHLATAC
jgi:hypothetical protein